MSSDTCLSSFVARLLVLAPRFLLVSWFPSLCCAESEDSIDDEFNSENSLQLRLYYLFSLPCYFLIETRCTAHCHFNRVQVQTLPTEQAAPVLTDSFSPGYDPYTHACKARPLTTVGRTSLSVIITIISSGTWPATSTLALGSSRTRCCSCTWSQHALFFCVSLKRREVRPQ